MPRARIAGVLLVILGVLTLGTGSYFLFLRPPLLPEDLRFTGVDPKLLHPRMITWLGIVFRSDHRQHLLLEAEQRQILGAGQRGRIDPS